MSQMSPFSTEPAGVAYRLMSAFAPEATQLLRGREMTRCAMCGRLRIGKENFHVAALVGAAMCSARLRGTHDRWP
jgi:cation transport regulator ChaC